MGWSPLPPGAYRIVSGTCSGYQTVGNLPLIRFWFQDFEVAAGEARYIGRLDVKPQVEAVMPESKISQAVNNLLTGTRQERHTYTNRPKH